jgi:hypothetical protein
VPEVSGKKAYQAPIGLRLGSVKDLTQNSGRINADTPIGVNNAFCNFGECSPVP